MREIAIQEKDLTLAVRKESGRLRYAKLKKSRAIEAFANGQITKENIQDFTKLKIIKNEKMFEIELDPERSYFSYSPQTGMEIPILYFKGGVFMENYTRALRNERQ